MSDGRASISDNCVLSSVLCPLTSAMLAAMSLHFLLGILFAIVGVVFGSFGNVLIFRVPGGESVKGRSRCPHCKKKLRAHELVPVLSFLFLGGKCSRCRKPISWQYPLVEAASGCLFVAALFHEQFAIPSAALLALCLWLLLLIAVVDGRTGWMPDAFTFPLIALAVIYALVVEPSFPLVPLLVGAGFFALQWAVSSGRWVGSGDILLGAAIGLLAGTWQMLAVSFFFAYILGSFVACILLLRHRTTLKSSLAFGPFLVIGCLVALFFGEVIFRAMFYRA